MRFGPLWNKLANPKNVPRLFAAILAILIIFGFFIQFDLNVEQVYIKPAPQYQINEKIVTAPYARGGEVLTEPGITLAQYPENSPKIGMINSYLSPVAIWLASTSPYFGTSICASPGGIIDEILYYTRGFDTILESSILMMSFVIALWLMITISNDLKNNRDKIEDDLKKGIKISKKVAYEVEQDHIKARNRQNRWER